MFNCATKVTEYRGFSLCFLIFQEPIYSLQPNGWKHPQFTYSRVSFLFLKVWFKSESRWQFDRNICVGDDVLLSCWVRSLCLCTLLSFSLTHRYFFIYLTHICSKVSEELALWERGLISSSAHAEARAEPQHILVNGYSFKVIFQFGG